MLGIIGATGKLGFSTLQALVSHDLIPASRIICTTSATSESSDQWSKLSALSVQVRHATFDSSASIESALQGCTTLFLVSSPRIAMDFNDAPPGEGREKDHFVAIDAARKAGVKRIVYTSLAFANPSKSNVMTAHERTEAYLHKLDDIKFVIVREGLYNESWPLYLGHWDLGKDDRGIVCVAGDGPISWTAIEDLGLANALLLAAPEGHYEGKTLYLSNTRNTKTLEEVAGMVSKSLGRQVTLKVVSKQEHEDFYVKERNMPDPMVKWWEATYDALPDKECLIEDTTLEKLLNTKDKQPVAMEDTVAKML